QASRYAAYFDVDWHSPEERLRNMVVLPVLGSHVGRVLDAGEIQLRYERGAFTFAYHDHIYPVAPPSVTGLLMQAAQRAKSEELEFIADVHDRLRLPERADRKFVAIRHRDKEVLRRLLDRICKEQPRVSQAIDEVVTEVNADPKWVGVLLDQQNYRLAYWKTA